MDKSVFQEFVRANLLGKALMQLKLSPRKVPTGTTAEHFSGQLYKNAIKGHGLWQPFSYYDRYSLEPRNCANPQHMLLFCVTYLHQNHNWIYQTCVSAQSGRGKKVIRRAAIKLMVFVG